MKIEKQLAVFNKNFGWDGADNLINHDCLNDLNFLMPLVRNLSLLERYTFIGYLTEIIKSKDYLMSHDLIIEANSLQLCEAFLKTYDLWVEDE